MSVESGGSSVVTVPESEVSAGQKIPGSSSPTRISSQSPPKIHITPGNNFHHILGIQHDLESLIDLSILQQSYYQHRIWPAAGEVEAEAAPLAFWPSEEMEQRFQNLSL